MAEQNLIQMKKVTDEDYKSFVSKNKKIVIEDTELEIGNQNKIKILQPENFELETTTIWSFPTRGKWATHYLNAKYRGNWAPTSSKEFNFKIFKGRRYCS